MLQEYMLLDLAVYQMKDLDPIFYVSWRQHFAQPLA